MSGEGTRVASIGLDGNGAGGEPSWAERAALAALRCIPGMRERTLSGRAALAIRGIIWTVAEYGASQLLRLVSTLLLARLLLGPEAFGLIALVSVFLAGLEMLSDFGIGPNVVQHRRGDEPYFLNTAFSMQAARGLVLWAAATVLAYPFAVFYKQPAVFPLVVAAAVGVALRGFASASVWTLKRHVRLRNLTLLTVGGEAVGFAVAIGWASAAPSAWALVAGTLANVAVFTIGSHLLPGHRISPAWDRSAARDILRFGAWISVSTGTYFLAEQAERLVLGKFVTVAELGCFSIALMIATAATRGIQQVIGQVFFPMIAQSARHGQLATAAHFNKTRWVFLVLSVSLGAGFVGYSDRLVGMLLPPEYAMTGWILQLLGFRAAFDIFGGPTAALLLAGGLSMYSAAGNMARLLFLGVGLYIAFSMFGFREAVWVLAISPVAVYLTVMVGIARHFKGVVKAELACFAAFLASAVLMLLAQ